MPQWMQVCGPRRACIYRATRRITKIVRRAQGALAQEGASAHEGGNVSNVCQGNHERRPANVDVEVLEERQPHFQKANPPRRERIRATKDLVHR